MAWIGEAAAKKVNVEAMVGAEIRNVSRNGTLVYFEYRPYLYQSGTVWSLNAWALWAEGNSWVVKQRGASARYVKYYGGWVGKTVFLGTGVNSCVITVGTQGDSVNLSSPGYVDLGVYELPVAYPPSLSGLTVTSVSDKSARAYFGVVNANNAGIVDYYLELGTANFGNVVQTLGGSDNTFVGLDPNRTYYVRGNSANAVGRSYTNVVEFKTGFVNPGNPGQPYLSCDQGESTPKANLNISWTAATNGSTGISGYRIRLFKNGTEVKLVDTDNADTTYNFGTLESNGFTPGDVATVGIYSYSKDWAGNMHFNGDGANSAQIFGSNSITVVSDKYIYASLNGGDFNKYKIYISVNGGDFSEIKKEKFKVIK